MMRPTKRTIRQARAIPVRGRRTPRLPRWRATPIAALVLSLLALLSPDLTLAPIIASEAIDATEPRAARPDRFIPLDLGDRGAGVPAVAVAGPAPSPAPAQTSAPDPVAAMPPDGERWALALDAARARGEAHGVSFAAVRHGELLWSGSSGRARDGATPLGAEDPMVIGSVTKTFVAATVLQLIDEGRLGLEDPVRDHLPQLRELSREITIEQLLDHTSGLADLFNDTTRLGLEDEPGHAWTSAEILETLHAPWYEPGAGWAYANTNYYLLGMIIEQLSGASLAEVLATRFLSPLGLEGTRVLTGAEGDPLEPAWTSIFWASGAMVAPAADLARWGDAIYTDGLVSPGMRDEMFAVNDHDYGLGVQRIEIGRLKGYGHTGLLNTYTTLLFHLPEEDVTVALLVNRSHVDLAAMLRAKPTGGPSLLDLARGR